MGVCGSHKLIPVLDDVTDSVFRSLDLNTSDINRLYDTFQYIDLDESGSIRKDEIFSFFRVEATHLTERIFDVLDTRKNNTLNFRDFVCGVWNMLSMDPDYLGAYVFFLFDTEQRGILDGDQIRALVEAVHRKSYESNRSVKRIVDQLRKNRTKLNIEKFTEWSRSNVAICAPFITLQHRLRGTIVGHNFWNALMERRRRHPEQGHPRYVVNLIKSMTGEYNEKSVMTEILSEVGGIRNVSASEPKGKIQLKKSSSKVSPEANYHDSSYIADEVNENDYSDAEPNVGKYNEHVFNDFEADNSEFVYHDYNLYDANYHFHEDVTEYSARNEVDCDVKKFDAQDQNSKYHRSSTTASLRDVSGFEVKPISTDPTNAACKSNKAVLPPIQLPPEVPGAQTSKSKKKKKGKKKNKRFP
mmetsp:Transcript_21510/g.31242  ORF Transcript_21510/g.31242 Transcript_21510/m.31242 type:complete len:414 (+) Transcript_21510:67-1308(+)|eukprot:CAMPEP_0185036308 /NCGR_PEP_ID=MMETSP1103-20130426/29114_1 /TAXON_ID=36769 /ORGANISM="Paraphysomonas bandaiensis, Strain Caron Lab Isolate" /LENGTH=413 /DNA_ID=CAMNT_0027573807 /DNA_START=15 /DNA_END=1256 /DNA_ORIENTATION=-